MAKEKKKVNYESYYFVDLLHEKVFYYPENRIPEFAIKFSKYENALNYLLKSKLNNFIFNYDKKATVHSRIQNLEEIINLIKPLLKDEQN